MVSLAVGCSRDPCDPGHGIVVNCTGVGGPSVVSDVGGGGTAIQLPFSEGESARCTQGTGGSYSHTGGSTQFGVDLDTPNDSDMELYAPVGGMAYVHTESATSGFGYHVAIDIGGGFYVVVAHLSEVFVENESEVTAGQLLGYEGCTGACSGDHVHIGLMEGDPSETAQFGESVDVLFRTADMNAESPAFEDVAGSALVCDLSSGHVYASDLPVGRWHPDGTLVKVPNDPKVYLVESGNARHIDDESVFWSYDWNFDDVVRVSDEELACLGTGEEIAREGSVDLGYGEDGHAWLLVKDTDGSAWKQRLPSGAADEVAESWGFSGDLGMDPIFSEATLDAYRTRSGTAPFRDGTILKESGRSDVYVVSDGVALPVKDWDTYLLMGYGERDILTVGDGLVAEAMGDNVGSCMAGIWCLDAEAVTSCGGGLEIGSGEMGGEEVGDDTDTGDGENTGDEEDTASPEEESDVDGDGIPDAVDNCPLHDNADQSDIDSDGTGDSCDADADGDEVPNGIDCDLFDASVGECAEEATDTGTDPVDEEDTGGGAKSDDAWSDYVWIDGDNLCFSADGFSFPYNAADAYMVGYGGSSLALDFTFKSDFRLVNSGDAYCLDTSVLDFDDYEVTLVSSLTSTGDTASSYADTGDWWDNYDFCVSGSETAAQFCAYQGGWNYLVGFSVATSGAHANGDGA
ncbi:hypothetical protein A2501_04795 [Candidatus Uhrbacteria bacterium RIFOXYC12_FULL_57_11]|nr:MAG: hypothetical protein A2501_04795 [Candidatus Uhrbacteria bacterium RIFOXYC12_FULL_57_11]